MRDKTPPGAFRFCKCFANHDRKTACRCECGQCQVYREELRFFPQASDASSAEDQAPGSLHSPDSCSELCVPRERWVDRLTTLKTLAATAMIDELNSASTDREIKNKLAKAELVYFAESDRLAAQRRTAGGGTPAQQCALCGVAHEPSHHRKAGKRKARRRSEAERAIQEAAALLGLKATPGTTPETRKPEGSGDSHETRADDEPEEPGPV